MSVWIWTFLWFIDEGVDGGGGGGGGGVKGL
jgi:hypothetical protein